MKEKPLTVNYMTTVSSSRFASTEFEFEFELEQQLRFKGRQLKQARSDLQQMQDLQQALILLQGQHFDFLESPEAKPAPFSELLAAIYYD